MTQTTPKNTSEMMKAYLGDDALPVETGTPEPKKTTKKTTSRTQKTPKPRTPAKTPATRSIPTKIEMRTPTTKEAKAVTLNLHPDDLKFLDRDLRAGGRTKAIRALVAIARADDQIKTLVERVAFGEI